MWIIDKLKAIPGMQKYRYAWIIFSCVAFLSPLAFIPALADNPDLCGKLCMRRFYLYFPGMTFDDFIQHASVAFIGVIALVIILVTTFFFGRFWCGFLCPVGGFPEMVSRMINDRWKIEFRGLPQVPIRYGYFATYLVLLPILGVSACSLCNFITVPRLFNAFSGGLVGIAFIFSAVGLFNLTLLFILGFFANKGRAYCQFLCPIGAMDGLVNRLGAKFKFTHRIRVERDRCSGCNKCARQCMTGAIKMVDRIAVVDQLSCMSCNECADVCDWDAIMWTTGSNEKAPKRVKKNHTVYPEPIWHSVYKPEPQKIPLVDISSEDGASVSLAQRFKNKLGSLDLHRLLLGIILSLTITFVTVGQVMAAERYSDPDGCMSCHGIQGLKYVDDQIVSGDAQKKSLLRNASINEDHYYSSLHGSVPCSDCHSKITNFPHDPKNAVVDCANQCHLNEPSSGKPYSHTDVTDEYKTSIHGKGWSADLTATNRVEESLDEQNPSCRRCHSNTLYVPVEQLTKFKSTFQHTETECGRCHQGETWLNQYSGHILRRLIGDRWNKTESNEMCADCHLDEEAMAKVERQQFESNDAVPADHRFISANASYDMTLHGRLIVSGVQEGASCIDCHAPAGFKHGILADEDPLASTHKDALGKTCGDAACHGYAAHNKLSGFVLTDMHDADYLKLSGIALFPTEEITQSWWLRLLLITLPAVLFMAIASIAWSVFAKKKKQEAAVVGSQYFDQKMLNIKRKKGKGKKAPAKKSAKATKSAPKTPPKKPSTVESTNGPSPAAVKSAPKAPPKKQQKDAEIQAPKENEKQVVSKNEEKDGGEQDDG